MALNKFNWQNGTQVEPAKVEIEGISYDVVDAQFEGETPLSAANLNLMQDTLLGNVVDDLEDESKIASCKAVKDIYSTDEVKTNEVWIDGKPIYMKTVSGTFTVTAANSRFLVNLVENVDNLIDIYGLYSAESLTPNQIFGSPIIGASSAVVQSAGRIVNGIVQATFIAGGDYVNKRGSYELTVKYTKSN